MLEKIQIIDRIEILELGQIQVREATRIIEDGKVISQTFHRHVLSPSDSLEGQDAKVVAIANAIWTPKVITRYQETIAAKEQ